MPLFEVKLKSRPKFDYVLKDKILAAKVLGVEVMINNIAEEPRD